MQLEDIDLLVAARKNFYTYQRQIKNLMQCPVEAVPANLSTTQEYREMLNAVREVAIAHLRKREELARATLATLGVRQLPE